MAGIQEYFFCHFKQCETVRLCKLESTKWDKSFLFYLREKKKKIVTSHLIFIHVDLLRLNQVQFSARHLHNALTSVRKVGVKGRRSGVSSETLSHGEVLYQMKWSALPQGPNTA